MSKTLIKKKVKFKSVSFASLSKPKKTKLLTMFRPMIRSRHPSHCVLRERLKRMPFRSVVRLGSTTELPDSVTSGGSRVECNTVEAVKNSASKFRMKECFKKAAIKTAKYFGLTNREFYTTSTSSGMSPEWHAGKEPYLKYPIVAKLNFGSRGRGMVKIDNQTDALKFLREKKGRLNDYLLEEFHNYVREYRLHVTKDGCFYTCRKMLKSDAPDDARWFRNDSNCVWIIAENPDFCKPVNWKEIDAECVKALKAVGLDIGACDVRVQGEKDGNGKARTAPEFIIVEINSAPSLAEITTEKYLETIPKVLLAKR